MADRDKSKQLFAYLSFSVLILLVILVSIVAAVPSLRERVRTAVLKPYRQVLAKVVGDLTGKGENVSVIKVKTETGLLVEVYKMVDEHTERLISTRRIEERRDAFMNIRGEATNLALVDLDNDGILEILAPAYDENLVPRLHVFKYDPLSNEFVIMGPDNGGSPL